MGYGNKGGMEEVSAAKVVMAANLVATEEKVDMVAKAVTAGKVVVGEKVVAVAVMAAKVVTVAAKADMVGVMEMKKLTTKQGFASMSSALPSNI
ncbi:hypothetical protein TIFTF001_050441 [Ficus carica]|uniref:Uncharacterized protein n=1 Tax=Ficus carica TaxID=3494 RepID=A0AA87ZI57_FICCA|nr:hypothetical protein TIFTF001_050440 [Ficus carica]GMN26875.1 hypothetical protein TIFTF001_050441 [Ficus carica]